MCTGLSQIGFQGRSLQCSCWAQEGQVSAGFAILTDVHSWRNTAIEGGCLVSCQWGGLVTGRGGFLRWQAHPWEGQLSLQSKHAEQNGQHRPSQSARTLAESQVDQAKLKRWVSFKVCGQTKKAKRLPEAQLGTPCYKTKFCIRGSCTSFGNHLPWHLRSKSARPEDAAV